MITRPLEAWVGLLPQRNEYTRLLCCSSDAKFGAIAHPRLLSECTPNESAWLTSRQAHARVSEWNTHSDRDVEWYPLHLHAHASDDWPLHLAAQSRICGEGRSWKRMARMFQVARPAIVRQALMHGLSLRSHLDAIALAMVQVFKRDLGSEPVVGACSTGLSGASQTRGRKRKRTWSRDAVWTHS